MQFYYTGQMAYAKVQFWKVFGQNGENYQKSARLFLSRLPGLTNCKDSEKSNEWFPRKRERTYGWMRLQRSQRPVGEEIKNICFKLKIQELASNAQFAINLTLGIVISGSMYESSTSQSKRWTHLWRTTPAFTQMYLRLRT